MVLDDNAEPFVASVAGDLINSNSIVNHWSGGFWSPVGTITTRFPAFGHTLAITPAIGPVPSGAYPTVAYRWPAVGTQSKIAVSEWNGTTWVDLGGPSPTGNLEDPSLAQIQGRNVVAFTRYSAVFHNPQVLVYEWDGTSWQRVGGRLLRKGTTRNASVGYAPNGNVVVACESSARKGVAVFEWTGKVWQELGKLGVTRSSFPRLAVGRNGQAAVAYYAGVPPGPYTTNCATWNGVQWRMMPPIANAAVACSVRVDSNGAPAVAYENPAATPQRIEIAWRNGPIWLVFRPPNPVGGGSSSAPLISLDLGDLPVVAWSEGDLTVFEGPDATRRMLAARLAPGPEGPGG